MRRTVLSVLVVGLALATPAHVLAARSWTVVADPDSLTINVARPSPDGHEHQQLEGNGIHCVRIVVPSDFEVEGRQCDRSTRSSGRTLGWTTTWPGGSAVAFRSGLLGGALGEDDNAVFRITGHAHTAGQWSWTAQADEAQHSLGTSCGERQLS